MDPTETLEALSRTFLDSALDCIITMDATGRVLEFNPASERVFGFTRSEAVGKELAELIIPTRLRERHRQGLAHHLKTGEGPLIGKLIEVEALRRDGSDILVALAINATQVNGSPIFTAYLRDITERKRAEETNRHLAAIIECSGDAIISKNLDEVVTSWNKGAERLFGYPADEIIGKPILVLIPPDRHDEELGIIGRLRQGEPLLRYETVYLRKDRTTLDVSLAVSPIKDETGNIIGASKIARDITERVRTERRRTTQYAVTNLLAASWTLAEVATELLEAMASSGDWAFAAIWTYDEAARGLRCRNVWHEALVPGFIVEQHSGNRCTVFIPSVPTPMAGAVYIIDNNRVHPLDLPAISVMQCISKWGGGSDKLLAAYDAARAHAASLAQPTTQQLDNK